MAMTTLMTLACLLAPARVARAETDTVLSPVQIQKLDVKTAPPHAASGGGELSLPGLVMRSPDAMRVISAPLAGFVGRVHVMVGDPVRPRDTLITFNAPELLTWQREHQQAALQATLARQTAERDQALLAEGLIASARAQLSQQQWRMAEAGLRERAQLLSMVGARPGNVSAAGLPIVAPGAGSVVAVLAEPGQHVEAGAPLVRFASDAPLWLELQAPPDVARALTPGDAVHVADCPQAAEVSSVNTELDPATQNVTVRARWRAVQRCVWPSQRVQASVSVRSSGRAGQDWLVPAAAVIKLDGQDVVFVRRGNAFPVVPVQVIGPHAAPGAATGAAAGAAPTWRQIRAMTPQALSADSAIVVQGALALKGARQGLGAQ
jgi:biotin carboxyl carrier protein